MTDIDNKNDQDGKLGQVILPLLGVLAQQDSHEKLWWRVQPGDMDESEDFEPIVLDSLVQEEQVWDGSERVKPEVETQVVHRDGLDVLVSHGPLDEAEQDLNHVDDVNYPLNVHECGLIALVWLSDVLVRSAW